MSKRDELMIDHLDNAVKRLHEENKALKQRLLDLKCEAKGCPVEMELCKIREEYRITVDAIEQDLAEKRNESS